MASTYTPIATTTASGSSSSVTFSGISGSYTDLVLVINAKGASNSNLRLQFNSDTGSNYSRTALTGNGSSASSSRVSNFASIAIDANGYLSTSDFSYNSITNINNYSNSTTYKTTLTRANAASTGTDATVGLWRSTSAITAITIFTNDSGNYASGSTFTLYGVKAA